MNMQQQERQEQQERHEQQEQGQHEEWKGRSRGKGKGKGRGEGGCKGTGRGTGPDGQVHHVTQEFLRTRLGPPDLANSWGACHVLTPTLRMGYKTP